MKVKFLFRNSNLTGFKSFSEYLEIFLSLCWLNVFPAEKTVGLKNLLRLAFVYSIPVVGVIATLQVTLRYFREIKEAFTGIITFIMTLQLMAKMIELLVHRQSHRQMIKQVEEETASLQNDREYHSIGVANFKRAKFYTILSSTSYLAAMAALILFPLYSVLLRDKFMLCANVELPGTNHKQPMGWAINYIYSFMLDSLAGYVILGKIKTWIRLD